MKGDILDSSAWIECLNAGPNTIHFEPVLNDLPNLIVPCIIITEVRKVVLKQRSVDEADSVTNTMRSATVVPIDEEIAVLAADLASQRKLPLADSLIYAITLTHQATLWTQDQDFKDLPQVNYFPKPKS